MPYKNKQDQYEAWKRHYKKNSAKYAERNRLRKLAFKEYIIAEKDKPCTDCGNKYPHYVMDFDHLGDKSFNVSELGRITSMKKLIEEIAKCELVCSNCHRIRTFTRITIDKP